MAAIRDRAPEARFAGVGGETMLAQGLEALAPLEALSVNGFKDPLLRLPSLLRLLRQLRRRFVAEPMDAVVGVDFNVFNLLLERGVKRRGIPTAHYVSPSVYFWRQGRIRRIGKAADVVLALFPFEPPLYRNRGARAVFVGHPLADDIDPRDGDEDARARARAALGAPSAATIIALLPGSRRSEIALLGRLFLDAAVLLRERFPDAAFLIPMPGQGVMEAMRGALAGHPSAAALDARLIEGRSRTVIAAADMVLTKSGTATLETMLLRRPMAVSYRLGALTAWVIRGLQKSPFVALPNILAGEALVPELLQEEAVPRRLATALIGAYQRSQTDAAYFDACAHWHERLRGGGAASAADAVLGLLADG